VMEAVKQNGWALQFVGKELLDKIFNILNTL
jgi:hypothetical protein